jgi:DNA invertase Pin-like site-specific DNA recombinase
MTMNKYERMNQERKLVETQMRVVAYCRVSTDKDDQANSYEAQQEYFARYIERMPEWELSGIFADKGLSGTNTKRRKDFNRMIACANTGDFDLIITKEISRFARNTLDTIHHARELKKLGVGVIFLNDNIDTRDPDAELRLTIMASIAQEESRKTSERVKWGQKRQMEKGVVFGRDMLGYDVRDGQMFINEDGAKIIRRIFDMFVNQGMGSHAIARELMEFGYTTITGRTKWSNTTIYKILRNEKYCGDLVQKKTFTPDYLSHDKKYNKGEEEFVIREKHHDGIISREMFEEANRILDERSTSQNGKSKHSNRYVFSGKIVCGECETKFGARYKNRKDGTIYKSWRCLEALQYGRPKVDKSGNVMGCTTSGIRNEDALHIMSLVMSSLEADKLAIIKNTISVIQSVVSREMMGSDVEQLRERIRNIEDEKERLIDLYMSKDITREQFKDRQKKYDVKLTELNELLTGIDKRNEIVRQQNELITDITAAVNDIVNGSSISEAFFRNILDRMVYHNKDDIEVHLNLLPHKWRFALSKATRINGKPGGSDESPEDLFMDDDAAKTPVIQAVSGFDDVGHFRTRRRHRRIGTLTITMILF